MSFVMMMSKSIVTYTMFRATRTIAKTAIDSMSGVEDHSLKPGTCNHCGLVTEWQEECPRCESTMHKMYRGYDYQQQTNLVDDNLDLVS